MLKELLEEQYHRYNRKEFIDDDPVSVPHRYSRKENIEIAGFLTATLAWGQRPVIIKSALRLMAYMGNDPLDYLMSVRQREWQALESFCHRTFSGKDAVFFVRSLANVYQHHGGLENAFCQGYREAKNLEHGLIGFRRLFLGPNHEQRVGKHVADITRGSAAKRLNLFLRWMVRTDSSGVDFGIWNEIPSSALFIPLDVHTGRTARALGLLSRKQDNWKAVRELTLKLREFDPADPVKYDFALFGMGLSEGNTER